MLNRREVLTNSKSQLKRPAQRKCLKEAITEAEEAISRTLFSEKYLDKMSLERCHCFFCFVWVLFFFFTISYFCLLLLGFLFLLGRVLHKPS